MDYLINLELFRNKIEDKPNIKVNEKNIKKFGDIYIISNISKEVIKML